PGRLLPAHDRLLPRRIVMNKADQRYGPARPRATAGIPTGELLGIKFGLTDYEGVLQRIGEMVARGERGYLWLTSVHGLVGRRRQPELAAALNGATLNLPDGMPVVWALNLLIGGRPLRDRVY